MVDDVDVADEFVAGETSAGGSSTRPGAPAFGLDAFQALAALGRLARRAADRPSTVVRQVHRFQRRQREVLAGRSEIEPDGRDRRFAHPAWRDNPVYRRLLQSYLVTADVLGEFIDDLDLDPRSRDRARFAVELAVDALAPTNALLGNPSALAKAVETRGRSLYDGTRHRIHDIRENNGMPSTVDSRPFKVGGNLAVTPGSVVHRTELFELIQYAPSTKTVHQRPLLAIPPQINKYYISDLASGRSLIEHTVAAGITYFAMSWRNPTAHHRDWGLDTYVEACLDALDVTCEIAGSDDANVMGMCAGAITMACMLGHLQATERAERVHATTYIVAGLDNGVETQIGHLASSRSIEAARTRSHRNGVLDGADLAQVFAWLRPNDLVWNYWVNNYLKGQNPPAFDVLHWNADTTRLPAALHGDFLDLQASNALAVGGLEVLETPVDLEKVGQDAYIVAGSTDHIVPWHQAFQTTQLLGGSGTFVLSTSGHIQAVVNPPGRGRASFRTAPDSHTSASDWWEASTVNEGTWWPHWAKWLKDRSGTRRKAPPTAGSAAHPAVDEAPGRYVHLR